MLSTDLESLAAILAKQTPGCQVFGMAQANENECPMCAAIVAAVNACGPLLERLRSLEEGLELHRRYHAKVGCPGEECYVCNWECEQ